MLLQCQILSVGKVQLPRVNNLLRPDAVVVRVLNDPDLPDLASLCKSVTSLVFLIQVVS